jgi:predicted transposase/invertase (TIGR01784 family)
MTYARHSNAQSNWKKMYIFAVRKESLKYFLYLCIALIMEFMKTKGKTKNSDPMLIRFDWAIKRLLRQKANYVVLEGFLSVLLDEKIKIINIKESESNQIHPEDKFNRVDIFVENKEGELFIIEIQNCKEADYFLRMVYGVSKAVAEHISLGDDYINVRKVYHINIVYFKLGIGDDYVYHGSTEFRGIHRRDVLQLTEDQKKFFVDHNREKVKHVKDLFPEYYILCVEDFDDIAKDNLDEWIFYLKNDTIPIGFTAQGLPEAREQLQYEKLSEQDKRDYEHHVNQQLYEKNAIYTAKFEGKFEGEAEGLAKGLVMGRAEGRVEGEAIGLEKGEAIGLEKGEAKRLEQQEKTVINSHREGLSAKTISIISELPIEKVIEILKRNSLA